MYLRLEKLKMKVRIRLALSPQGQLEKTNFSLWHQCSDKSTTETVAQTQTQGSNISHLVHGDYDKQQCTYITLVHTLQGLKSPRELIQLYLSITPPRTTICKEMFLSVLSQFPLFVSARLKRTGCFLSLIRSDSGVKTHRTEAIHCWLAMAPMRAHSPHNNELLRVPEDTAPVRRTEIKRQVRSEEDGWGRGENGGNEFNIQQMWDILLSGRREEIFRSIQMLYQSARNGN